MQICVQKKVLLLRVLRSTQTFVHQWPSPQLTATEQRENRCSVPLLRVWKAAYEQLLD